MITDRAFTEDEIASNHKIFKERMEIFKKEGFDITKTREVILEAAGKIIGSILEVGTGKGHMALALARQGHEFTSVDRDEEALRFASLNLAHEKLDSNAELLVMDSKELKFDDGSFENIIAVNFFHHVDTGEIVLSEMDRVLKKDGKLILADFDEVGFEIIDRVHHREGSTHENLGFSLEAICLSLEKLGYRIERFNKENHWILIAKK